MIEDDDPVGRADSIAVFNGFALQAGLITPNEVITPQMLAFATLIVDRCASIADAYGDEHLGGNAGEQIRTEMYD